MSDTAERKIIGGVGIFLLATEILKQLMLTFVVNGGAYSWWNFPWQLCSIPMYVCLAAVFSAKLYDTCLSFLSTFGLMAGCAAFLDVSGFNLSHPLLTAHSYVWHFVLIGLGIFAAARRKSFHFLPPLLIYLGTVAVAQIINVTAFDAGHRPINMFYISPKYVFSQPVIKELVPVIGNNGAITVYIIVCIAVACLINVAEKYLRSHMRAEKAERKIHGSRKKV